MDIAGMLLVTFKKEPANKSAIRQCPDERPGCPAMLSVDISLEIDQDPTRRAKGYFLARGTILR